MVRLSREMTIGAPPDQDALTREGAHVMTVCNACRYCEQYCPVFPAMEERRVFTAADLNFLANLCHNCGECLYACQYAPPHEFGINVPRTLTHIRLRSFEQYAWPRPLARAFRHHGAGAALLLAAAMSAILLAATLATNADTLRQPGTSANFYAVIPHDVMVLLFGAVSLFVAAALLAGLTRFWRDVGFNYRWKLDGLRDALTLRHLHASGADCVIGEETRTPWRRYFHHCTFYGFMLCAASTTVAAIYHSAFGWPAPYGYTSLPVFLGAAGGLGLVIGPVGLWLQRRRRDPALGDPERAGLDLSFLTLLLLTSVTGLALLLLRETAAMGWLLIVHLGAVLALFVTLPYGKFVHALYRTAALLKHSAEQWN